MLVRQCLVLQRAPSSGGSDGHCIWMLRPFAGLREPLAGAMLEAAEQLGATEQPWQALGHGPGSGVNGAPARPCV